MLNSAYTIERISNMDQEFLHFAMEMLSLGGEIFGKPFDVEQFDFHDYASRHLIWACKKNDQYVGSMLARLTSSVFDPRVVILMQDSLMVKPGGGRAASLLLKEFIDFGRAHANLIYTMRTKSTNIKGRSLEKLGFKKTEELYCIEV